MQLHVGDRFTDEEGEWVYREMGMTYRLEKLETEMGSLRVGERRP